MSVMETSTEMTVQTLLGAMHEAGFSEDEAIETLLATAGEEALSLFVRANAHRVFRAIVRRETRKAERRLRKDAADTGKSLGQAVSGPDARQELVSKSFWLPDGRVVGWLVATAEDHLLRATWQRSHAESAKNDAALHEAAAAIIREHGVTCLADLPEDLRPEGALV